MNKEQIYNANYNNVDRSKTNGATNTMSKCLLPVLPLIENMKMPTSRGGEGLLLGEDFMCTWRVVVAHTLAWHRCYTCFV